LIEPVRRSDKNDISDNTGNLGEEEANEDHDNNSFGHAINITKNVGLFIQNIFGDIKLDERLVYDSRSGDDSGGVEILFIPYLDDNEIWLTYNDRVNSSDSSPYPKVTFSTFIYN
jgi:hypothetical protein